MTTINVVSRLVSNNARNYDQFCTMLASVPSRISQHGVINVSVSDHRLIYCARKVNKVKTGGVHKHTSFRLFKTYIVDAYKDAQKKVDFPNYELFNDVNEAYSNLCRNLRAVIYNIVPCKIKRIEANAQKLFDEEVLENMNTRDKRFKKFKKSKLHIVKEL